MSIEGPPLNPTQQDILERLRIPQERRPSYRSTLKIDLRHDLEHGIINAVDGLDEELFISKRQLSQVHGCEANHLAEAAKPFEWTVPLARGTVAHKAIELSFHLPGQREPTELVDEAVAVLIGREARVADFLATCGEAQRADLRGEASALVGSFLDTFPTLRRGWRPGTEVPRRAELCGRSVVLFGRFDLTIGMPVDTTAGRVIIDVKTGGFAPDHREDLRFYALIETLVTGVPPLMVATHYVDSGLLHEEAITEVVLDAAVRRTVAGIVRLCELRDDEVVPVRKPGPTCRWCPIADDCEPGQNWLGDADDL